LAKESLSVCVVAACETVVSVQAQRIKSCWRLQAVDGKENNMDTSLIVRLVAGSLGVVLAAIIVMRRRRAA
jgi:hypothetical protein